MNPELRFPIQKKRICGAAYFIQVTQKLSSVFVFLDPFCFDFFDGFEVRSPL